MNIASNGIRLHVADQGKGALAIVFLHGWGASTRTWEHVIAALPPGYRTVAIDQRGWGSSEHPSSGYSLTELAEIHATGQPHARIYATRSARINHVNPSP